MSFPLGKANTMVGKRKEREGKKSLFEEILATLGTYRRTSPRHRLLDKRFWSPQKHCSNKPELPNLSLEQSPKGQRKEHMMVLGSALRTKSTARLGGKEMQDLPLASTVKMGRIASGPLREAGKTLLCIGTAVKIPN